MIIVAAACLEHWTPDFSSSGQPNPDWIRLQFRNVVVCNSIEWAGWNENPIQVEICEQCGIVQCASDGYIHATRMDEFIFWTKPRVPYGESSAPVEHTPSAGIREFGALAIPVSTWEQWRQQASLPAADIFPVITGEVLADVWLSGLPPSLTCHTVADLMPLLKRTLIAADDMEVEGAIQHISQLLSWSEQFSGKAISGTIQPIVTATVVVTTLFLDGSRCVEWPAFALHEDRVLPMLSPDWVIMPNSILSRRRT